MAGPSSMCFRTLHPYLVIMPTCDFANFLNAIHNPEYQNPCFMSFCVSVYIVPKFKMYKITAYSTNTYMMTESKIKETRYSITSRIQRNRIRCRYMAFIPWKKPYKCSILYCIVQLICICAVVYGIYTMAIKSAGKNNV